MVEITEERYKELLKFEELYKKRLKADQRRVKHLNEATPEERKARAKKAIEARWAKYRAEHQ